MLSPPTIYWQNSQIQLPLFTYLSDPFLTPEGVRIEKGLVAEGAQSPLPGVPFACVHKWWHRRLMGPSCNFQPDIGIHTWCPPTEYKGVASRQESFYWRGSRGSGVQCLFCRNRGLRFHGFLRGQMGNGGGGDAASFLGRRWRCG